MDTHIHSPVKSLYPLCALRPVIHHSDPEGFSPEKVLSASEGPLKISPLFPDDLTPCSRGKGRDTGASDREKDRLVR